MRAALEMWVDKYVSGNHAKLNMVAELWIN